jgi:hypothetical protein
MKVQPENLNGKKFGRWTVIKNLPKGKCVCKCDCGIIKNVYRGFLKSGRSKSCGCLRTEITVKRNSIHNQSNTKLYYIYRNILNRCNHKTTDSYYLYGGRGIRCLWKSFNDFYRDMSKDYKRHIKKYGKKNTTIDRIDSDDNYYKENCRWVTNKEQARNKRNSRFLTYKNITKPLYKWADELGIKHNTISNRWHMGWSHKKIIEEPIMTRRRNSRAIV